jgi:multidrug efflux pump subunit AcrA (membrane-fusion protein)
LDIARAPQPKRKKYVLIGAGVVGLLLMTLALTRLEPRAPGVDRATLLIDSVSRGTLVRQVRAPGTLVPERNLFISAVTQGRVEALPLRPGAVVEPNTLIAVLTNPDVEMQALDAQRQLGAAEAQLITLRATLEQQRLTQQSAIEQLQTQLAEAQRQARTFEALGEKNLASTNEVKTAQERAADLAGRIRIAREQLRVLEGSVDAQIRQQEQQVKQMRTILQFQQERLASMQVRAGESGVLQELPLELGVWVTPGQRLARVAQPGKLKAVLRVPESQAKDIVLGQETDVDTRNGIVKGRVMRVDPIATNGTVIVEVALEGELPAGARSDISVDGTIEIERLDNVLYTQRPGYGQPESTVQLFKLEPDGKHASRVTVQLGRASVNTIEIRGGLQPGDKVIVSDITNFDNVNRIRLQ